MIAVQDPVLQSVAIDDLRPTQITVGMRTADHRDHALAEKFPTFLAFLFAPALAFGLQCQGYDPVQRVPVGRCIAPNCSASKTQGFGRAAKRRPDLKRGLPKTKSEQSDWLRPLRFDDWDCRRSFQENEQISGSISGLRGRADRATEVCIELDLCRQRSDKFDTGRRKHLCNRHACARYSSQIQDRSLPAQ